MFRDEELKLWVQVSLAHKYLNEFFKDSFSKEDKINPYDFFILSNLRLFENLSFYEINKHMPIDTKVLHNKINKYINEGLMERAFLENGSSAINLTDKARKIIKKISDDNIEMSKEYFDQKTLKELGTSLYLFNEKMREILEMEIGKETINKINKDLF